MADAQPGITVGPDGVWLIPNLRAPKILVALEKQGYRWNGTRGIRFDDMPDWYLNRYHVWVDSTIMDDPVRIITRDEGAHLWLMMNLN